MAIAAVGLASIRRPTAARSGSSGRTRLTSAGGRRTSTAPTHHPATRLPWCAPALDLVRALTWSCRRGSAGIGGDYHPDAIIAPARELAAAPPGRRPGRDPRARSSARQRARVASALQWALTREVGRLSSEWHARRSARRSLGAHEYPDCLTGHWSTGHAEQLRGLGDARRVEVEGHRPEVLTHHGVPCWPGRGVVTSCFGCRRETERVGGHVGLE